MVQSIFLPANGFVYMYLGSHSNLPANLGCPGGNASWEKVEVKGDSCLCEGQKNVCNQTGQMCKSILVYYKCYKCYVVVAVL